MIISIRYYLCIKSIFFKVLFIFPVQGHVIGQQFIHGGRIDIAGGAETLAADEFPKTVDVVAGHEEKLQAGLRHIADRVACGLHKDKIQ